MGVVVAENGMREMGKVIERALSARGESQRWLARKTGSSSPTISRYVNGRVDMPDPKLLDRIARVLDLDAAMLLSLAGLPVTQAGQVRDPRVAYVATQLDELPEDVRGVVIDAFGAIVEAMYRLQDESRSSEGEADPSIEEKAK